MRLAGLTVSRLENELDTDMALLFHILFKCPKIDEEVFTRPNLWYKANRCKKQESHWKTVKGHAIADLRHFSTRWEGTESRELAEVRIYNDGCKRFKVDSNDPTLWHDKVNGVTVRSANGNLAKPGLMARVLHPFTSPLPVNGLHEKIVTMDILDKAWIRVKDKTHRSLGRLEYKDLEFKNDFPRPVHVDHHGLDFLPETILHEFMHSVAYGREDHRKKAGDNTAGWGYCMKLTKEEACGDAECIALLAVIAGLGEVWDGEKREGGYSIPRFWHEIPNRDKWNPDYRGPEDHGNPAVGG